MLYVLITRNMKATYCNFINIFYERLNMRILNFNLSKIRGFSLLVFSFFNVIQKVCTIETRNCKQSMLLKLSFF